MTSGFKKLVISLLNHSFIEAVDIWSLVKSLEEVNAASAIGVGGGGDVLR